MSQSVETDHEKHDAAVVENEKVTHTDVTDALK